MMGVIRTHLFSSVEFHRALFDSKTEFSEFIVYRSPQLRCDLSGLSVNVGKSQITQSLKVRDFLGSHSTNLSFRLL